MEGRREKRIFLNVILLLLTLIPLHGLNTAALQQHILSSSVGNDRKALLASSCFEK